VAVSSSAASAPTASGVAASSREQPCSSAAATARSSLRDSKKMIPPSVVAKAFGCRGGGSMADRSGMQNQATQSRSTSSAAAAAPIELGVAGSSKRQPYSSAAGAAAATQPQPRGGELEAGLRRRRSARLRSNTAEDHPRASASSIKVSRSPSRARLAAPSSFRPGRVMSPGNNSVVIGGGCGSKKARSQDCRRRRIRSREE
jgi:hypothetical protein